MRTYVDGDSTRTVALWPLSSHAEREHPRKRRRIRSLDDQVERGIMENPSADPGWRAAAGP